LVIPSECEGPHHPRERDQGSGYVERQTQKTLPRWRAQVGILHLADFDATHALAVQRDIETGALNLRLLAKPILYP